MPAMISGHYTGDHRAGESTGARAMAPMGIGSDQNINVKPLNDQRTSNKNRSSGSGSENGSGGMNGSSGSSGGMPISMAAMRMGPLQVWMIPHSTNINPIFL